jgi:hypothetical protein
MLVARISHKLEIRKAEGRGERTWYLNSPLLPCSRVKGFERCGDKSGVALQVDRLAWVREDLKVAKVIVKHFSNNL